MRPLVDTSCPNTFGVIKRLSKREKLIEERFSEIEKDNKALLDKMTQIMNTNSLPVIQRTESVKSLNLDARKRKLIDITVENQAMLKRIKNKRAAYSVKK